MADDNLILAVAVIAVIASLAAAGFSYYSVVSQGPRIVGYASESSTGTANLTVETAVEINFSVNVIDWGSGKVDTGETNAVIDSENTVVRGNWTANNVGLILDNIGNINVSLELKSGKDASEFIGGTSPEYKWKVTDKDAGSCINATGPDSGWGEYATVSKVDVNFCNPFGYQSSANAVRVNINLTIPYNSKVGALSDTLTATATAV